VRNLLTRILVGICGAGGELVRGAMNVGIFVLVEVRKTVDDGLRLLRRCRIIEPDQAPPIYLFLQDRKIPANGGNIELPPHGRKSRHQCWLKVLWG
jgi:hypothetical protein